MLRLNSFTTCSKKYSSSSKQWLKRHVNDVYVAKARELGYRSRAAFKLQQFQQKYKLFKPGMIVVDCGSSPGGWSQVAIEHVSNGKKPSNVFAVDLLPMEDLEGCQFYKGNFLDTELQQRLLKDIEERLQQQSPNSKQKLKKSVDVVLTDMAPSFSGNHFTDQARTTDLCFAALEFATLVLKPGGFFLCKFLMGESTEDLKKELKRKFRRVIYDKPQASRQASTEGYFLCLGFH